MSVRRIHSFVDPVLRRRAQPVERIDKAMRRLIDDMIDTMRAADGIGLAAPQVGVSHRLFVAELDDTVYVVVNPRVLRASRATEVADEGCLSLPGYVGAVERRARVIVRGLDRRGKEVTIEAEGMLARCFQHEIDHLDGVLYTDRMASDAPLRPVREDDAAMDGADAREEDAALLEA